MGEDGQSSVVRAFLGHEEGGREDQAKVWPDCPRHDGWAHHQHPTGGVVAPIIIMRVESGNQGRGLRCCLGFFWGTPQDSPRRGDLGGGMGRTPASVFSLALLSSCGTRGRPCLLPCPQFTHPVNEVDAMFLCCFAE